MNLDQYLGVSCPAPDSLRTGDLVFPRAAGKLKAVPSRAWISIYPKKRFSELILSKFPLLYGVIQTQIESKGKAELLGAHSPTLLPLGAPGVQLAKPASLTGGADGGGGFDLDDPEVQMFLYKVISLAFGGLLSEWFGMTVDDFRKSDLGKFLLKALTADDPRDSFFVGHLAMIIREMNGEVVSGSQGRPFVIEANTTDFSHYRVAVHSYVEDAELGHSLPPGKLARGWVTRRLAEGEKVWAARAGRLPMNGELGDEGQQRLKLNLAAEAKAFHGRPYGFFDNPRFGDTDRMYCSEFLHNVFQRASDNTISIADHRNWGWVLKYLAASQQVEVRSLVAKLMKDQDIEGSHPFFVLTPSMIWSSAGVRHVFTPDDEEPYSPAVE